MTVTDAHGCKAGGTDTSFTITQPAVLSLAGAVSVNVSCYGVNNGSITTNVTGGTTPYTYSWNTGSNLANLTSLAAGTYSVTVTDAHGCTVTGSYTITQPAAALAVSAGVTNVSCNGGNGTITTTVTGGTTPYAYLWRNSANTANLTTAAGAYSVTVTDAHGCATIGSYTITQPAVLATTTSTTANVACNGGSTGNITTVTTGGTTAYTYLWSNGAATASV